MNEMLALTSEQIFKIKDMGHNIEDFLYTYFSFKGDERYLCFVPNLSLVSMGKLTSKGFDLLSIIDYKQDTVNNKELKKQFDDLWNTYPSDNGLPGFPSSRLTRGNKQLAYNFYKALRKEYEHSAILNGTIRYIDKLKEMSTVENKLHYLPNLSRFLEEKRFEEFESKVDGIDPNNFNEIV